MKRYQSIIALVLCLTLLCACTQQPPQQSSAPTNPTAPTTTTPTSGEAVYTVTLSAADGSSVNNVIVNFLSDGEVAGMQIVVDGVASKTLPKGSYTIELVFTDTNAKYEYDISQVILTVDSPDVTVTLTSALADSTEIYATSPISGEHRAYTAYYVQDGVSKLNLDNSDRNYVLFVPVQAGQYRFSVADSQVSLGYYGSPHYVLPNNSAELAEDGSFVINVTPGMIGTAETGSAVLVIGMDSDSSTSCELSIVRIGDHIPSIAEMPWDIYQATVALKPYTMPENYHTVDFDLTASANAYRMVLNQEDGFYHLNHADGPLVYAKLSVASAYLAAISTILDSSGINRYFYDEEGNFLRKESYSECLLEYIANVDPNTGLYPLTEDLVYIFQQRGEYEGWWNKNSHNYLFVDVNGNPVPGINSEIAWLFLCCYGKAKDPSELCADGHTEVIDEAKAPTCTEAGLTQGKHCSVCGKVIAEQQRVEATGHSYGDWVEVTAPTSEATGLSERTCEHCGKKEQKTLDKLPPEDPCAKGHTLVTDAGKAATCTEEGLSEGQHCSICGTVTKSQQIIPATGHSYGDWIQVQAPTYDATGLSERTCASCGNKEQETIAKLERPIGTASSAEPVDIYYAYLSDDMTYDVTVGAGEYAQYNVWWMIDMTLSIKSEDAYLIFNDVVYWPENGVIDFELYYENPRDRTTPCTIYIGNCGSQEAVFTIQFATLPGTMMNPVKINTGTFTTELKEGNDQGYYYLYTATASGTITITVDSASSACYVELYNLSSYECPRIETSNGVTTISISVKAGDQVRVNIGIVPDSTFYYAAGTVVCTATFE